MGVVITCSWVGAQDGGRGSGCQGQSREEGQSASSDRRKHDGLLESSRVSGCKNATKNGSSIAKRKTEEKERESGKRKTKLKLWVDECVWVLFDWPS